MDAEKLELLLAEIRALDITGGVEMSELLMVSEELRQLFLWMIRQNGFQTDEMETYLDIHGDAVHQLLDTLVEKGLVEEVRTTQRFYAQISSTRPSRKYKASGDLWKALE